MESTEYILATVRVDSKFPTFQSNRRPHEINIIAGQATITNEGIDMLPNGRTKTGSEPVTGMADRMGEQMYRCGRVVRDIGPDAGPARRKVTSRPKRSTVGSGHQCTIALCFGDT